MKRFDLKNNRELVLLAIIIVFSILVQARNGQYLSIRNILDMLTDTSILIIMAGGMLMVMLTGGIDLSIASIMAFAGMCSALVMYNGSEIPTLLIILISAGIGFLLGLFNGIIISKGNVLPIIATMGTMNIFRGLTYVISNGEQIVANEMTEGFKQIATQKFFGINVLIIIAAVAAVIVFFFLNNFRLGRRIYAVGSNSESAKIAGTNNSNILIFVYSIMGLLSGFCGILWVSRYSVAQGDIALGFEMNTIAACVLGGVSMSGGSGKLQGVLLGAILIGFINNALPMLLVSNFWKQAIQGAIILAAVIANVIILRNSQKKRLQERRV